MMKRIFLVIIALAFILETPRSKILNLLGEATDRTFESMKESRIERELEGLPNPLIFQAYNSHGSKGFISRKGYIFQCEENIWGMIWSTDDAISWSQNSDGSFTLYNSKNNTSTRARYVGVRAEAKGYY